MLGSLSIVVAHHMYAMPPYPYITELLTQLFIIHTPYVDWWILCSWWCCSCCYFMVRDYTANNYNNLLDRVLRPVIQLLRI
jgi:photosystem I P700 chlorophyll a apoprotein A1